MKFICTQENLLRGLAQVASIAGRNTQLPVLQYILLEVREGVLHLTTTDLEIGIHAMVGGKMDRAGRCIVLARKLLDYVQQLPNTNPIHLEKKGNNLSLITIGFRAQFTSGDPEDFPLLPVSNRSQKISLGASALCRGLDRTLFAAARDTTRPEICSVFLRANDKELRVAATDSFRLSEDVLQLPAAIHEFSFLLPLATAHELVRLFNNQTSLSMYPHDNYVVFSGEGVEVSSRLIDGQYPDYQQIIPTTWRTKITINRDEVIRALKTVAVFLARDSRRVRFFVTPAADELVINVAGSESGEGEVHVTMAGEGPVVEILFNIQYVLEGCAHLSGKKITLLFSGSQDPMVMRSTNEAEQFLYMIMPIQI